MGRPWVGETSIIAMQIECLWGLNLINFAAPERPGRSVPGIRPGHPSQGLCLWIGGLEEESIPEPEHCGSWHQSRIPPHSNWRSGSKWHGAWLWVCFWGVARCASVGPEVGSSKLRSLFCSLHLYRGHKNLYYISDQAFPKPVSRRFQKYRKQPKCGTSWKRRKRWSTTRTPKRSYLSPAQKTAAFVQPIKSVIIIIIWSAHKFVPDPTMPKLSEA